MWLVQSKPYIRLTSDWSFALPVLVIHDELWGRAALQSSRRRVAIEGM
jgi:hypothetical protein